ncbi:MAG: hypothetical protein JWL84_1801, partial [Rhodospirillales bacterium]|nr:hypothetical protein [Rhodospirillales bacterium]
MTPRQSLQAFHVVDRDDAPLDVRNFLFAERAQRPAHVHHREAEMIRDLLLRHWQIEATVGNQLAVA